MDLILQRDLLHHPMTRPFRKGVRDVLHDKTGIKGVDTYAGLFGFLSLSHAFNPSNSRCLKVCPIVTLRRSGVFRRAQG